MKLNPTSLGPALLILGATVGLYWANSVWAANYSSALQTVVSLGIAPFRLSKTVLHWINDGLMGIFFFHVGLEIKREVLLGNLASMRKAALPLAGALGGMVVPALLYLALTFGTPSARGWAVPMATDIAFALGVLAALGSRIPIPLKVFVTALAVIDDIGAVLVIALVYTDDLVLTNLALGLGLFLVAIAMNRAGVRSPIWYLAVGLLVWLFCLKSGVHATIAALLMAFVIPARGGASGAARDAESPLLKLEHALLPVVAYFVLPVFAFANAGVSLEGVSLATLQGPVTLGVIVGLFLGKPLGILAFCWAAVKLGLAELPKGVSFRLLHAASVVCGIGFTMALFIGSLAFPSPAEYDAAKLGVLVASALSALLGLSLLIAGTSKIA